MSEMQEQLELYAQEHQSLGCKLTHMFGVPMLAIGIPMLIFNRRLGFKLLFWGFVLQIAGHYLFEGNNPVLSSKGNRSLTIISALVFVADEWSKLMTGKKFFRPQT